MVPPSNKPPSPLRAALVLVIEPDPVDLKLLAYLLAREGAFLLTARDGAEALQILETSEPALVIVNLELPGMDGLEVARRIRAGLRFAGTAIVAISALGADGVARSALAAGCDGYADKPINTRALPPLLADILARRKGTNGGTRP